MDSHVRIFRVSADDTGSLENTDSIKSGGIT